MKKRLGLIFLSIAGLFPLCVGMFYYSQTIMREGIFMIEHVAFTNLLATGLTILIVTYRLRIRIELWLISLLGFHILWTAGNDAYIVVRHYALNGYPFPYPVFPFVFGAIGLILMLGELYSEK